jgi:hypothetical protein
MEYGTSTNEDILTIDKIGVVHWEQYVVRLASQVE